MFVLIYPFTSQVFCILTAAQLAQLGEGRSAEREVVSSNPGRTHQPRSLNNWWDHASCVTPFSVQMIASLGGDVKPLALSPLSLYFSWRVTEKNPWHCSKRVGDVGPDVMVYLTCAIIGLGGRGVIKTWTEVAARVRLYMLTSDLTSLVPPQFSHWLQVRKVGTVIILFFLTSCKDFLIAKKIEMTFYSIMGSISHLGKMARTSAKSENPNELRSWEINVRDLLKSLCFSVAL